MQTSWNSKKYGNKLEVKKIWKEVKGNSNVLRPGHHYQKFKFHQQQETLAAHFDFTSFPAWPFFKFLAVTFLHQGCFG